MMSVTYGASQIDNYSSLFRGKKLGLVTNSSGILNDFTTTIDKLANDYCLVALFAPEHGVRGDQQDGQTVVPYIDQKTGVPVYSLYGVNRVPLPENLKGIDVLVFDIQDVGSRYYTFIYTMANCMQACAKQGIPFVILDRPNPISGLSPEGTTLQKDCRSFVGMYDIPQRYALTCGELASFFNKRLGFGTILNVVPMKGWEREMLWEDTELPWVNPSPNIATPQAALLYNGTCLFEGTNLSEGRGTTHPFEYIGAPWLRAEDFADVLNSMNLPGVRFRPMSFIPTYHKHAGEICNGVQVHITDARKIQPVLLGAAMILVAREQSAENFLFTPPRHEEGDYTIDLLFGSPLLRSPYVSLEEVKTAIQFSTNSYEPTWRKNWIYL